MKTVKNQIETLKQYPPDARAVIYSGINGLSLEIGNSLCEKTNTVELHCAARSVQSTK